MLKKKKYLFNDDLSPPPQPVLFPPPLGITYIQLVRLISGRLLVGNILIGSPGCIRPSLSLLFDHLLIHTFSSLSYIITLFTP